MTKLFINKGGLMTKLKERVTLAKKIVEQAKKELNKEREENLTKQAKSLLQDIQEAKRTVTLLERQLTNFMKEVELD